MRRWLPDVAPLVALAARLGAVMGLYSVVRLVFWLWNRDLMPAASFAELAGMFWGGLRFDLSAVLYTNALFVLALVLPLRQRHEPGYQRAAKILFLVTNTLAIAFNWIDVVAYRITLQRFTAAAWQEYGHEGGNILVMAWEWLLDVWPLAIAWVLGTWALAWLYDRVRLPPAPSTPARVYYPMGAALMLVALHFAAVGMRGGFFVRSHRPINNSTAGAYVEDPAHTAVVLNNPFSIIRTLGHTPIGKRVYFPSAAELDGVYSPVHPAGLARPAHGGNVVVFILESFGREHVGGLNRHVEGYEGFTPFLDSLMEKSLVFTNAYANGAKSIDALPSIVAGVPALLESYILSPHYPVETDSLAELVEKKGYDTSFFHGAPNGSMGFEAFVKLAGYDRYFGMTEYANEADFDGTWGIWDEEFMQFFARELTNRPRPFLGTLFSLSSHHPYNVPARYEGKLRVGPMHVQQAIHYTDTALARFFETAAQQPWFSDTLFVITADHGSAPNLPEYKTSLGRFRVPLLLYAPGDPTLRGRDDRPAMQLDILPTVARWVGYDGELLTFGNDLLDPAAQRYALSWREGAFQLVKDGWALRFDGDKTLGLYRYPDDLMLEHNLVGTLPEVQERLEAFVKAIVQQFTTRMLEDRMTLVAAH
jgi:phosphoglycerol transferase MdoB-like AlkP superfamily enzyme